MKKYNKRYYTNIKGSLNISRLETLFDEFQQYLPNLYNNEEHKFARNPFDFDINTFPEHIQEQAIDLKYDSAAKGDFENYFFLDKMLSFDRWNGFEILYTILD